MIIRHGYKFRIKSTPELEEIFWCYAGHCRFAWNYFLSLNKCRLKNKQRIMRYYEMDFWSKVLKESEEYGFLREAPAHIIQQKLRDLETAYSDAFDKNQPNKRLPRKRKKTLHSSFRFPEPKQFEIENSRVKLPKLGWVRFNNSQKIIGTPKNITISYEGGHWYISIQVERNIAQIHSINDKSYAGIDMGVVNVAAVATLDNKNTLYESRNSYKNKEEKLAKAQRKLSRRVKFSKNWRKAKVKVQKVHKEIADARKDHLHKISHEISKNHAIIFIEDLKIKNMSASASGTQDKPGKNVKAKSGLNKAILDQGLGEFRRQLEYKSHWKGGQVVAVAPHYTSQKCSRVECGHVAKDNRKTQAKFLCVACGFSEHADINSAKNVLAAGLGRVGL